MSLQFVIPFNVSKTKFYSRQNVIRSDQSELFSQSPNIRSEQSWIWKLAFNSEFTFQSSMAKSAPIRA